MSLKPVLGVHAARREDVGSLVTHMAMPAPGMGSLDPFLFLAHHGPQQFGPRNEGLPFGPHPHRGFETVTFMIAGEVVHRDNAGYQSVIGAGGVQWMTAGSGIVHAEQSPPDFLREGGRLEILQLWVNLPAKLKFAKPRYQGLQADAIPLVVSADGKASVQVIAGEWSGVVGPVESLTGMFMSSIAAKTGGRIEFAGIEGRRVFLYVVSGSAQVNRRAAGGMSLVELGLDGGAVSIEATSDAHILFGHGAPIGEPVVTYGPFVMNTEMEIRQAIRDFQMGKFGPMMA